MRCTACLCPISDLGTVADEAVSINVDRRTVEIIIGLIAMVFHVGAAGEGEDIPLVALANTDTASNGNNLIVASARDEDVGGLLIA